MAKKFKISKDQIHELVVGYGYCFASDKITVDGNQVGFMYRETPDNPDDSGWRFLSGTEDDDYMNEIGNHALYSVNTIANYDQSIIPLLDSEIGSVFEKADINGGFKLVSDWHLPDE